MYYLLNVYNTLFFVAMFAAGSMLASFISAFVYRFEAEDSLKSFFLGHSYCEACKHKLSWYDLFPILSFALTLGRCRYCKEKISLAHPFTEIVLGITFVLLFFFAAPVLSYIIVIMFFVLFIYDLRYLHIPSSIIHVYIGLAALWLLVKIFVTKDFSLAFSVVEALIYVGFLSLLNLLKKSFGFGDILVIFCLGLILPLYYVSLTFWVGIIVGGVLSIFIVFSNKQWKEKKIAFLPFLYAGLVYALVFGPNVVYKIDSVVKFVLTGKI